MSRRRRRGKDANELQETLNSLAAIMRGLKKLRTTVHEKQRLEYATSALSSLRVERTRVEHLLASLPSKLPNILAQKRRRRVAAARPQTPAT